MTSLMLLAGLLATQAPALTLQQGRSDGRVALRVGVERTVPLEVRRDGDEIVVVIAGEFTDPPAVPSVEPPLAWLKAEASGDSLRVRIGVDPALPYEIQRDLAALTIIVGALPAPPAAPPADADTAALYSTVLPSPLVETAEVSPGIAGGETPPDEAKGRAFSEGGILLGRLALRPWLSAGYVDGEVVPANDQPAQHQRYAEMQPRIVALMPVGNGSLRASYEARFRNGASLEALNETSHVGEATLDLPLGSRFEVHGTERFARGAAEIGEVDPGREYFSGLAVFTHNEAAAGVRAELGPLLSLEAEGQAGRVRFSGASGFFDHDTRGVSSRLSRELGPRLRLGARLGYSEIDAPTRAVANMHALSAQLQAWGDLAPLTTGSVSLGYTDQENPEAPEEGRRFRGWVGRLEISRELSRTASLRLAGTRATHASSFENNGFYVTTAGEAELVLPLPFALSLRGGTGYHVNGYRVTSALLGLTREDRIFTWSLGLARRLGRWGFWRADYQRERRDSNIDGFDHDLQTFTLRLGLGLSETLARQ